MRGVRRVVGCGALLALGCVLGSVAPAAGDRAVEDPAPRAVEHPRYLEAPDDAPARVRAVDDPLARSAAARAIAGHYMSVQVNVDAQGYNVIGDAANEPSIAVDPTNPQRMVVGWRQFDSVSSNFRQAGWAASDDGGQSWSALARLAPGQFRSDPVLDFDAAGNVYFQSLSDDFLCEVYRSAETWTWEPAVPAYGGDKNWMVIDRSGGEGDGQIWATWRRYFSCCGEATLTRSTDGASSFEPPVEVERSPGLGTMAVGPAGELYLAGVDESGPYCRNCFVFTRSEGATDPLNPPTLRGQAVELGGWLALSPSFGPNPAGLGGQVNVAADNSTGPGRGNIYLLASVSTTSNFSGPDPMDVHFIRSRDGGRSWSRPRRITDDPPNGTWHWFGALAVAPNGRIDVIWNDTRNTGEANRSQLFYAWSYDQGQSWSANVAASPVFDSHLGWPRQNKLGDYYTLVSDATGANVAYAATFNGEQDIFFVRLFPDCNTNGVSDELEIHAEGGGDCNGNGVLDACEAVGDCVAAGAVPAGAGEPGALLTLVKQPAGELRLAWGESCAVSDLDYEVYEGDLGDFTSHRARLCSTAGLTSVSLGPDAGNTYYLVVPRNATMEGSYGRDSAGRERLRGQTTCLPPYPGACED